MLVKMKSVKEMKKILTKESSWVELESGGYTCGINYLSPDYVHDQLFAIAEQEIKVIKLKSFCHVFKYITESGIPIISDEYFVNIQNNGAGI